MSDLPGWLQATRQQTPQRRRPLPRSMRPAWETTPEANQPLRTPQSALSDPRTVQYEQRPTQQQIQQDRELERFARMHELNRNEVNTPPGTYFGQDTLEMTGAPALSRGMDALAAGDPGRALPEVAMGGASILGWGFGATPAGRAPRLPRTNAPMDMADLGRLASQGFDESDAGFFARMASDEMPTPQEALGRPLTPDHIWNDPRFTHRMSITSDLEGVQPPVERFRIAGERIEAQRQQEANPRPRARIERGNGTVMLHHPEGGGEFHRTVRSARESAERQGWAVDLPDDPPMPNFMRGEVADRLARQRRLTESNEAAARRMAEEQGLEHPPAMAGIPDYLAGWPGRGLNSSGMMDEAGRVDQGRFTADLLEGELGPYRLGGPYEEVPLMGTPEIAADPMARPTRPGFGQRPPTRTGPNEDRYLFGRPPPRVTPQARSGPDAGPSQTGRDAGQPRLEEQFGPSIQHRRSGPFDWSRVGRENSVGGLAENMELGDIAPGGGWAGVPDTDAKPMGWADGMIERVRQERLAREASTAPDGGPVQAGRFTIRTNPERDHVLEAVDNEGRVVGFLDVELSRNGQYAPGSGPYARAVHVNERSRRQGVATALYQEAERRFGRMVRSDNPSPDAEAFWESYRPSRTGPNAGPPRTPPRPRPPPRRPTQ